MARGVHARVVLRKEKETDKFQDFSYQVEQASDKKKKSDLRKTAPDQGLVCLFLLPGRQGPSQKRRKMSVGVCFSGRHAVFLASLWLLPVPVASMSGLGRSRLSHEVIHSTQTRQSSPAKTAIPLQHASRRRVVNCLLSVLGRLTAPSCLSRLFFIVCLFFVPSRCTFSIPST